LILHQAVDQLMSGGFHFIHSFRADLLFANVPLTTFFSTVCKRSRIHGPSFIIGNIALISYPLSANSDLFRIGKLFLIRFISWIVGTSVKNSLANLTKPL